jgi:hypothetical protein
MTSYPREITLKKERFILAHGFRHFSQWLADCIAFRPCRNIMKEGLCGGKLLPHSIQEASEGEGQDTLNIPPVPPPPL